MDIKTIAKALGSKGGKAYRDNYLGKKTKEEISAMMKKVRSGSKKT